MSTLTIPTENVHNISLYMSGYRYPSYYNVLTSPFYIPHADRKFSEWHTRVYRHPIFRRSSIPGYLAVTYMTNGQIRHSLLTLIDGTNHIMDANGRIWIDACHLLDMLLSNTIRLEQMDTSAIDVHDDDPMPPSYV